jgi:hypothetical protein
MAYTPFRFVLDFFRADEAARGVTSAPDLRYLGFTTAQYVTMAFFFLGAYLVFIRKPRDSDFKWRRAEDSEGPPGGDKGTKKADAADVETREAPPSETPTIQAPPVNPDE